MWYLSSGKKYGRPVDARAAHIFICLLSAGYQRLVLLEIGAEISAGCQTDVGAGSLQQSCDDAPVAEHLVGTGAA